MKCDKLFKDAFEGIEFRYKLDDTLEGLGTQKLTAKQLEGYLLGKGVSPKEIKQSGIFKGFEDDNRALPASDWLTRSGSQRLTTENTKEYSEITLGRKGDIEENDSYKASLALLPVEKNAPYTSHFKSQIFSDKNGNESDIAKASLLGWRRSHVDTIDGKKTLVLNEVQSDWAQTERAGRGTFESNSTIKPIGDISTFEQADKILDTERSKFLDGKDFHTNRNKWFEYLKSDSAPKIAKDAYTFISTNSRPNRIFADFPMSEVKHTQYQIVSAINDALKEGIDTVAIPIERQNELAGTEGVTKFYDTLNVKILPEIRKKLEKQGLKISVNKKPYASGNAIDNITTKFNTRDLDRELNDMYNRLSKEAQDLASHYTSIVDYSGKILTIFNSNESFDNPVKGTQLFLDMADYAFDYYDNKPMTNQLWVLNIDEVPNTKVKWDVYSVLAALGIGAGTTKSEANMSDNPDKYKLAKRIGSKLNYNESDTEIAEYFASIESGGDYTAKNNKSSAFGKYQVVKSTLVEKAKDLGISTKEARTPEGQEMVMHSLLSDYISRLKEFDLPVTKENMFVLHNLGQTGGVRVLRGTYTGEDIKAMRFNVSTEERKLPNDELVRAYTERYNINIPPKQEN